jgi:2'-5' RNA ligase
MPRASWGWSVPELPAEPRLFVAVELPASVREALALLQSQLRRRGLDSLRWARPEGIHLTLKFLGETPAGRVPAIAEALGRATAGVRPHELRLGSLGAFGGRSPRVVWVDIQGRTDELLRLQRQTEEALAALGFAREKRAFSPHVTLARIRPEDARHAARALPEALAAASVPEASLTVEEMSLMMSKLGPGGAVYTRLEAFPLR